MHETILIIIRSINDTFNCTQFFKILISKVGSKDTFLIPGIISLLLSYPKDSPANVLPLLLPKRSLKKLAFTFQLRTNRGAHNSFQCAH